jgi:hypothetical protein
MSRTQKPSPGSLTSAPGMEVPITPVTQALSGVINAKNLFDNEVNQRKQAFAKLPRVVSSVMRLLEASGASSEKLDDARTFAQQISGYSSGLRLAVESGQAQSLENTAPARSQLQMSYASKADWFARLIKAVASEPLYQPNEAALSVAGLTEKLNTLQALNQRVSAARVAWSNTLIGRNQLLYEQEQSLFRTAVAVKKYVRAIYGHDSEQYAQVKALQFTKRIKR